MWVAQSSSTRQALTSSSVHSTHVGEPTSMVPPSHRWYIPAAEQVSTERHTADVIAEMAAETCATRQPDPSR
jgi:hypothetical protein